MFLAADSRQNSRMGEILHINSDYKRSLLEGLALFRGVDPDDVQELLQNCDRRDLQAGELLLSPGSKNENVYIVLSGGLDVHVGSIETPALASMSGVASRCVPAPGRFEIVMTGSCSTRRIVRPRPKPVISCGRRVGGGIERPISSAVRGYSPLGSASRGGRGRPSSRGDSTIARPKSFTRSRPDFFAW